MNSFGEYVGCGRALFFDAIIDAPSGIDCLQEVVTRNLEDEPQLLDLPTVIAIALVAYAASNVVHEALGHGGACVILGGRPLVLSSVHFDCGDAGMGAIARRGVAAAGTIANFVAGALALPAFKRSNPREKRTPPTSCGCSPH